MHTTVILIFIFFIVKLSTTSVNEIACKMLDTRSTSGVCVNVRKCTYAIGNLKVGINPTTCRLENDPQAVCCPTVKRISEQKCEEFTKKVLRQRIITGKSRNRRKLILQSNKNKSNHRINTNITAGESNTDIICPVFLPTRISGGRNAFTDEYPHQVSLGYGPTDKTAWRCGGVLISERFVLTAAHCVQTKYGPPERIMMGDKALIAQENPARQIIGVEQIITHFEYKPPSLYNDLALIKLVSDVPLSRSILPACLPQPQYRLDKKNQVTVTGFGQLGAIESSSDTLQSVDLKKLSISECSNTFMNDTSTKSRLVNGVLPSQFCAGDLEGNKDTCHGDSGGPAVVTRDYSCIYFVVGITSFGSSFCGIQQPGVYTNVLRYLEWIENVVWPASTVDKTKGIATEKVDTGITTNPSSKTTPDPTTTKTPRTLRPKTTNKPMFMADTLKTVAATMLTTMSSTQGSIQPHRTTAVQHLSITESSTRSMILERHKGTTPSPISSKASLLNKLINYERTITQRKFTDNVTSDVSTILSLIKNV